MVAKYGWKVSPSSTSVSNGDGSVQVSPGTVCVHVEVGSSFKVRLTLRVIKLARYQVIIGMDMTSKYKIEMLWEPWLHFRAR